MHFSEVVNASRDVGQAPGRLVKVGRLSVLLAALLPEEIEPVVAFLSGQPRQARLGIGHAAISAISQGSQSPVGPSLTILDVDAAFDAMATLSGPGSSRQRVEALGALLARASDAERDFLRRLLYGELRQGALEGVVVEAIAKAAGLPSAQVRRGVMMSGNLGVAARAALTGGSGALDAFGVRLMQPVRPMLADSADDVGQALEEIGDASLEYKLDGARIQVHKAGDEVRLYSRTLNDVTASAPEIVKLVRALPARDAIFDGEAIALEPDGTPRPFQVTMRRFGRTRDVAALQEALPLTPFLFDCLYLDGTSLIDDTQERRVAALRDIAQALAVPRITRPSRADAEAFVRDAAGRGHEGVMAKALDAPYAAGRRGASWLKIKQARSLDLVVLAAEWGHGRRRGLLSNLHLGARDPSTNAFVMLGKTFKGMTDQMLAWQTTHLQSLEIGRDAYTVFVRPELVVEVAFNEVQDSPVYPGGVALRFARVKRYRTDKKAADADTIETVRQLAAKAPSEAY
jgi:DNA ligase-1